jgi:hypothetical protein
MQSQMGHRLLEALYTLTIRIPSGKSEAPGLGPKIGLRLIDGGATRKYSPATGQA